MRERIVRKCIISSVRNNSFRTSVSRQYVSIYLVVNLAFDKVYDVGFTVVFHTYLPTYTYLLR